MADEKSALAKLEEAEELLNTWLVDNTDKVFEEQPEIDSARELLLEAIEALNVASAP